MATSAVSHLLPSASVFLSPGAASFVGTAAARQLLRHRLCGAKYRAGPVRLSYCHHLWNLPLSVRNSPEEISLPAPAFSRHQGRFENLRTQAMGSTSSSGATSPPTFLGTPYWLHFLSAAVPALVTLKFFNGSLFGYHPTLLSIGFLMLMGEGILISVQAKGKQRKLYLKIHAIFQGAAAAAIAGGMWAIYQNKVLQHKLHLQTLHSRVGVAALAASVLVSAGGVPLLYGLIPQSLKKLTPKVSKGHKIFGAVAYGISLAAILLGLQVLTPLHPLHKGWWTYAIAAGTVVLGSFTLHKSFAVLEVQKWFQGKN